MKRNSLLVFTSFVFVLLFSVVPAAAQWSTSTSTDSALYVCPGFYPFLLTFRDGSSIVFGSYAGFIKARKLDPRGYFLWPEPVTVVEDESTLVTQHWGGAVDDGHGGAIICYVDNGRSYVDDGGYENNDLYLQHLDSMGTPLWGPRGKLIADTSTGKKSPMICSDGKGGCVVVFLAQRFRYPGSDTTERISISAYSADGEARWSKALDSTHQQFSFQLSQFAAIGDLAVVEFFKYDQSSIVQIPLNDPLQARTLFGSWGSLLGVSAEALYSLSLEEIPIGFATMFRIDLHGDTLWKAVIRLVDTCAGMRAAFFNPVLPQGSKGVTVASLCGDTVVQIDSLGSVVYAEYEGLRRRARYLFSDDLGGVVAVGDNGIAIRYGENGLVVYGPTAFISDPDNAYFNEYRSDFHGGVIAAFWTTAGGIYAQHTGRNGKPGIIDAVKFSDGGTSPQSVELMQNYPNPFNPSTVIEYELSTREEVFLAVYDALGRRIMTLVDGVQEPGFHSVRFSGEELASGMYTYVLRAAHNQLTKRMLLIK